jgi:hypothetical protein
MACRFPDKVKHPDKDSALAHIRSLYRNGKGSRTCTSRPPTDRCVARARTCRRSVAWALRVLWSNRAHLTRSARLRPTCLRHSAAYFPGPDIHTWEGHHGLMAGPVEQAVRSAVSPGQSLSTPSGRGTFSVARYTADKIVLLLGEKEAWTPIPWRALEEVPDLLRGRSWVPIGSTYSTHAVEGTLDGHLKGYIARATGGWVAVVLEIAGVIQIDRSRPARVKLTAGW